MASSMNIMGTYSGITMDTVEQLIKAESGKVVKYTSDQTALKREQSAWKDVQTRLTNLSERMGALAKADAFDSKKVTLSEAGKFTLAASPEAVPGEFSVQVERLATRTQVTGAPIGDASAALNLAGELVIGVPGDEPLKAITIEAEDSIEAIVGKINESTKDNHVSAVIIDKHIVLQSKELGDKAITIGGSAELLGRLGLTDAAANTETGLKSRVIVNGIPIERDSNTLTDIMAGVTLTLQAPTTDPVQVTVADDVDKTTKLVQDFIDQYNSTMSFISDQLDVGDPSQENNKTGALAGDGGLMRLQSQLRSLLTSKIKSGKENMNTAGEIGIAVDRQGVATLDKGKLEAALRNDRKGVTEIFSFTVAEDATYADGTTVKKDDKVGLADTFATLINSFTDSKDGIIATKNATYDKSIKDLTERIDVFNERLESKRARYIEQFTALDIAMMEAESQMNYLMSQIGAATPQK